MKNNKKIKSFPTLNYFILFLFTFLTLKPTTTLALSNSSKLKKINEISSIKIDNFFKDVQLQMNNDNYNIHIINTIDTKQTLIINSNNKLNIKNTLYYAIPFSFLIISIIIWYLYGKQEKPIETPEFYPPENLNSLEIGYIYKGRAEDVDILSLLVYLANKGYIKISEVIEKKLYFLPKGLKITKLKDYDGNNINEKAFLEGLFDNQYVINNEVTTSDLYNKFYKTIDKIKTNINTMDNKYNIYEIESLNKKKYIVIMMILTYLLISIPVIYDKFSPIFATLVFPPIGLFVMLHCLFGYTKTIYINGIPKRSKKLTKIFGVVYGICFGGIIWYFEIFRSLLNNYLLLVGYFWGLLCILGMYFCFKNLSKRTKYGLEMLGKIKGFKNFLATAEKDRLEALVNQNPTYFYDILPFMYVLGISNKWIEQIEDITLKEINSD